MPFDDVANRVIVKKMNKGDKMACVYETLRTTAGRILHQK